MKFETEYLIYFRASSNDTWTTDPDFRPFSHMVDAVAQMEKEKIKFTHYQFAVLEIIPNFVAFSYQNNIEPSDKRIITI